jgi:N-acetylglucosamine-6-phosphate deacetylase
VVRPGVVLQHATIVLRDGLIHAVQDGDVPPAGAKPIDLTGKTVYAGFLDAFTQVDLQASPAGPAHWNDTVTPQRAAGRWYRPDAQLDESLRSQGFAARLVVPQRGVIKGTSCIALTDGGPARESLVARQVATHVELTVPFDPKFENVNYPNSPMGAVALARQAMLDAAWHRDATRAAASDSSVPHPEANLALESLAECLEGGRLVVAETSNEQFVLRAHRFAREFALRLAVRGSGNEYRRLEEIAAAGRPIIVPVNFPKPPRVTSPDSAMDATLEELMHWRLAPENPARLRSAGVTIALTSHGLKDRQEFLERVRKAVRVGLSADDALAAVTTAPCQLLGVAERLGTIERGKIANLVVTDGDLFTTDAQVLSTWIAGREFEVAPPTPAIVGCWKLAASEITAPVVLQVAGDREKLEASIRVVGEHGSPAKADDPPVPEDQGDRESPRDQNHREVGDNPPPEKPLVAELKVVRLEQGRLTARLAGGVLGLEADTLLAATVVDRESGEVLIGSLKPLVGETIVFSAQRQEGSCDSQDEESKKPQSLAQIELAVNYPLGAYGRAREPDQPRVVLFKNATVWTCGDAGRLESADVLVRQGVIESVGDAIAAPTDALVIDATGRHLTPGIIDCHSHMATDGGLNEFSQAVTAEVRVADFLDPDDITIYRQLAGGVTAANVLHGSANPIGGQNQVIKLRWGATAEALRFDGAPAGIKFALGENVKQSNWGDKHTTRYPQTRMGVDEIMIDAFHAAQAYQARHEAWRTNPIGPAPRRDLELEAIAQILRGERWIHCHSYRQSELLTFLHTLQRFGITVGSLQHVLEGYKVAPELAAHGAMASTFADWWAYKYEVYDAIPYNGEMMHRAGIVVSFNSDNNELGRHLNHEAAKAVKYGGVTPEEALKFVTLNPAKQLRIDQYVGSIDVGKQADLVLWDGPPLSIFSKCEQTWIDGRRYFDRTEDAQLHAEQESLRMRLVQAVIDSKEAAAKDAENEVDPATLWPRHDHFCHGHDHGQEEFR